MTKPLAILAMLTMPACSHDAREPSPRSDEQTTATSRASIDASVADGSTPSMARIIASEQNAASAIGTRVRVRGSAERDKLGDAVRSNGFTVTCLKPRFPAERLDHQVEVEGMLESTSDFQATRGPDGEISQGTAPGSIYVIANCTLLQSN